LRFVLLFLFLKNEGTKIEMSYTSCLKLLELLSVGVGVQTKACLT
jgi:hypothetical protein